MKNFIAIDHSVADHHKHQEFDTAEEAQAHIDSDKLPNGFVASNPGGNQEFWLVDMVAKTVAYDTATETTVTTERAFSDLRAERDQLLKSCDDRFLSDTPSGRGSQAWKDYRQALRDLPATTADPFNPVWPIEPA